MWLRRPDFFRVQAGVNVFPLELHELARSYSAYTNARPLPEMLQSQMSDDEAVKGIVDVYHKIQVESDRGID
jgi:hypothetical protein